MIIDTHIHLDDSRYDDDFDVMLERAKNSGVEKFIIPGADVSTLKKAIALSEQYENIYFAVGIHPYDLEGFDEVIFHEYVKHPKCVAIGECGLDYFRLEGDEAQQEAIKTSQDKVFRAQIRLAKQYQKPLIVHIRDASRDAKAILIEEAAKEVGGVLHCFNADEELLSLSNHGFYYGIGGVLTFKNAKKLVNVLPKIPQEKLLIETDGPYLTPHPHRGERNEPSYTTLVANKMSELLDIPRERIDSLTTANAKTLFSFV